MPKEGLSPESLAAFRGAGGTTFAVDGGTDVVWRKADDQVWIPSNLIESGTVGKANSRLEAHNI